MRVVRTVEALRAELAPFRRRGLRIGLVPTMGALHEGHLSLLRGATEECDVVVVSLFVNPAQFNERSDLERYPRREAEDARLAEEAGAAILFAPAVEEVYPAGFATSVEVVGVSDRLEGASRGSAHFRGVCTVVAKLFAMVLPDVAYFGQKDAQQVAVIRRMVGDLNLPVRVRALATVREADGLAMSSRNALLSAEDRSRASALHAALTTAAALAAAGERSSEALVAAGERELARVGLQADYLVVVDPNTFEALPTLDGPALIAVAARVGGVRLIDNTVLEPNPSPKQEEAIATCSA